VTPRGLVAGAAFPSGALWRRVLWVLPLLLAGFTIVRGSAPKRL
jgi:hypothetical protein